MKKIYVNIADRKYLVGFSTSLYLFLESIQEDIDFPNAVLSLKSGDFGHETCTAYHTGHRKEVFYSTRPIVDNEKCFHRVSE
jgi:hypothetical protein